MFAVLNQLRTLLIIAAFLAAFFSFLKNKEINSFNRLGRAYILATVLACGLSLTLLSYSGWTLLQAFSLAALVALIIAPLGERIRLFGASSSDVAIKSYSASVLFQLMATASRMEGVGALILNFLLILIYIVGITYQTSRHRKLTGTQASTAPPSHQ